MAADPATSRDEHPVVLDIIDSQTASQSPELATIASHASRRSHCSQLQPSRSYVDSYGAYSDHDFEEPEADQDSHSSKSRDEVNQVEKPSYKEVVFEGDDDPLNPKNLPTWRKWSIVIILALGSICVTLTSSVYTTTYEQMNREFGNSTIVATLGLTLFVFGLGLAPMLLGPLSEFYGRRPIYVIGYATFTIWLIPSAVAQNIQTMLVSRFFDGLGGSAFLSVAGGTVGDMFTKEKLAAPMMIYSASPFLGPGGFRCQTLVLVLANDHSRHRTSNWRLHQL